MKTILVVSVLLIFSCVGFGQQFNVKFFLDVSDTVEYHALEWADADNDGLLDIMAFARNPDGEEMIFLFQNDTVDGPQFIRYFNTGIKNAAYVLADYDGDNRVDAIVSGEYNGNPVTSAFVNSGNFLFEAQLVLNSSGDLVKLADLNQDGFVEVLLSGKSNGEPFLKIFQRQQSTWVLVNDSIKIHALSVETFDFDYDHDVDMFLSGTDEHGQAVSLAYVNRKGFYFKADHAIPLAGKTAAADFDHDGNFDVLVAGKGLDDEIHTLVFQNTPAGFKVIDSLIAIESARIFAADFNSDGVCDISLFGVAGGTDTLNLIRRNNHTDTLAHKHVVTQSFGDLDHDGDLDLVQFIKSPTQSGLLLYENSSAVENLPPAPPGQPVVAFIFDRLFMYWERAGDDRTPTQSVTYDVSIQSAGLNLMTAHFDIFNGKRLLVGHGNNGTTNYVLLRAGEPGVVNFQLQAVDNAMHAGPRGICLGSGGGSGGGICSNVEEIQMEACRNEQISLSADAGALWFSFAEGFLERAATITFLAQQADTIFSVAPNDTSCSVIKVYTINTPTELTKTEEVVKYLCEGDLLRFGVEPDWDAVEWSSAENGFLSHDDSIEYVVMAPDTVKVTVSDGFGCHIQRNHVLNVSKPGIETGREVYHILRGESVALKVSGGITYEWLPASGLNDPQSPNPIATPTQTTEYFVLAKDSLGCSASASVVVVVEDTAFVPNLFTPNYDGSNDVLKIYGLGNVTGFSFSIYNREGSRVYHTNDVSEVINNGWNGTAGGADQPAGVYYWNVRGETVSGKNLRLNGKNSGSVVLIR